MVADVVLEKQYVIPIRREVECDADLHIEGTNQSVQPLVKLSSGLRPLILSLMSTTGYVQRQNL